MPTKTRTRQARDHTVHPKATRAKMLRAQDLTAQQVNAFWRKVTQPNGGMPGCWLWTGRRHRDGHGQLRVGDRVEYAHRVSFALKHGQCPRKRLLRHLCSVPACVNPDHLRPGTKSQNARDYYIRKRLSAA